jgi:hypothetical protein
MSDLDRELESVEARVVASRADITIHGDALKAGMNRLVRSPYVIGGALIGTAAAGYFLFRRCDRRATYPQRSSGSKLMGLLKVAGTLLPLIGALSAPAKGSQHPPDSRPKSQEGFERTGPL